MSLLTFLAFSLTLTTVCCSINFPRETKNISNNLSCQIAAANDARATFVNLEDIDEELLRCLSTANVPILTTTLDSVDLTRDYSSMHLLTISTDTRKRLQQIGAALNSTAKKKHLSKYVLIFRVPCEKFLEFIFRLFWRKGFLNAIALCSAPERIYTYERFTESGFKVVQLTPPPKELFYDKLRNLHHYQIRASQFYDPIRSIPTPNSFEFRGTDGILGKAIARHLNATMQIFSPPNGELYGSEVEGVLSGSLKQVATGIADVSWNLRFIDKKERRLVEPLYPIGKSFLLHLVVPKARTVPQYANFIRVFNTATWWMLLLHFIIATALFSVIQKMALRLAKRNDRMHVGSVLATFLKAALGVPIDGFYRISSLREFLISWILFCYVTRAIYLAKMESVFIHPKYEEDLDSLGDLWRLKVPIYAHDSYIRTIESSLNPEAFKAITSRHCSLPENFDAFILSVARSSNKHAFILRRERAKALIAQTVDKEANQPMYHIVKEYLVALPQSYIVTQGSVFYEKFNSLVMRCYEHGLMKHWDAVSKAEVTRNPASGGDYNDSPDTVEYNSGESSEAAIVLNMDVLQGAFYLWIIGMGGACLGFLMEVCYNKWKAA